MSKTSTTLYIFFAVLLAGCDSTWYISELYIQKIENSSKVIYAYDAWGGLDSHIAGYVVLDSTQTFDIYNVQPLPFSLFEAVPTKNLIRTIDSDESDYAKTFNVLFNPVDTLINNSGGFTIETKVFQFKGFMLRSGGYKRYQFEKFTETHDSIFFNLDDVESMESEHLDTLKFKKTNIYIHEAATTIVSEIEIEDVQLSDQGEFISNIRYSLKPKNQINTTAFSDIGIFKPKKFNSLK